MKEINDNIHDVLVKYLLGEATIAEVGEVNKWIEANDDNRAYFNQLKTIWDESRQLAPVNTIDENDAWNRFQQKQSRHSLIRNIPSNRFNWMKIAAILVVVTGIGWLGIQFLLVKNVRIASSDKEVLTHTLPDGSEIVLNKNASIEYSGNFKENDIRSLTLSGEAFFNITQDAAHPFIITTGDVSVKVLGTSFNIKNSGDQIEVVVETGSVDVSKNSHSVQLKELEKAIVTKDAAAPIKSMNTSALYNHYRSKQFICDATPLHELVTVLNDAYQTSIKIAKMEVANYPLTATFEQQSLDSILNVIAKTFDLEIEKGTGEIILK